ncbi:uncharacterized protein LOC135122272 [Zophobas morio]|uniref:uncharacterized protein LOC135122272 n=1 Tax=Zophobas morio TaxID=2755281 RepID=UPI00308305D2
MPLFSTFIVVNSDRKSSLSWLFGCNAQHFYHKYLFGKNRLEVITVNKGVKFALESILEGNCCVFNSLNNKNIVVSDFTLLCAKPVTVSKILFERQLSCEELNVHSLPKTAPGLESSCLSSQSTLNCSTLEALKPCEDFEGSFSSNLLLFRSESSLHSPSRCSALYNEVERESPALFDLSVREGYFGVTPKKRLIFSGSCDFRTLKDEQFSSTLCQFGKPFKSEKLRAVHCYSRDTPILSGDSPCNLLSNCDTTEEFIFTCSRNDADYNCVDIKRRLCFSDG